MNQKLIQILIGALMVFTVFPVRQYARNWMAVKLGDDTPVREGRLTLNPLAHVDPVGCIFMILVGLGWGRSASINPANFKTKNPKLAMIQVALAGPVANLLFALIMAFVIQLGEIFGMSDTLVTIFSVIMTLNVRLAVFLMLPVPGFDGGDILMMFLPAKFIWKFGAYFHYVAIACIILVCFGPLGVFVDFISSYVTGFVWMIAALVTGIFGKH